MTVNAGQVVLAEQGPASASRSLVELAGDAVAVSGGSWSLRTNGLWCVAQPAEHTMRRQGWKLHLSATSVSAAVLLERVLPVLVPQRCAFKFAATLTGVRQLNSARWPRGSAGKFLTVYPDDEAQFRRLAAELDRATAGLRGPAILSDRRYRPGSVVFYRFGAFTSTTVLDDDGCYRPVVVAPDGELVEDRREAWYSPPAWAPDPFPEQPPAAEPVAPAEPVGPAQLAEPARTAPAAAPAVLIGDRFVVQGALRHSSSGGVFAGQDRRTGGPVVVKQARAYVDVDPAGWDCRDRLRHEADLYGRLAPLGLAPGVLEMIDAGEHLFLVREQVAGTTLRRWVTRQAAAGGVPTEAGLAMARALLRLVSAVHRAGLVLIDVSPNNIMVDPDGALWLIDLDHAAEAGQVVYPAGTPGYTPPEHRAYSERSVLARPEADLFGLGGLLFLIAVGTDPVLAEDDPAGRPVQERVRAWLDAAGADLPLVARLAAPVLGLMRAQPATRWRPERVLRQLELSVAPARALSYRRARPGADRLIEDGVGWLVTHLQPSSQRLWAAGRFGASTDPCAVQHGAAGVLATLVRAAPVVADPGRVREAVGAASRWLERQLPAEPRVLPGLYFGRSGTAWALYEAAGLLDDPRLAATALDLAARVPVADAGPDAGSNLGPGPAGGTGPAAAAAGVNPDVAHGLAGAGTALLHLWQASGDPRLEVRVRAAADALVATVRRDGTGVCWPIPAGLRSTLAGRTFTGYAHGTAGIGAFLLAAGAATGDTAYTELARQAADTLVATARRQAGAALWPAEPAGAEPADAAGAALANAGSDAGAPAGEAPATTGWCTGSAGIGAFLLRAWQVTGDPRHLELARAAALAAYRARARGNSAACHGLAGAGQLFLDLAAVLAEPVYHGWAEQVAGLMAAKAVRHGDALLVPDETGLAVVADYGVGLAGVLAFLVRLRYGGPRPWTVEPNDVRVIGARRNTNSHHMGIAMTTAEQDTTRNLAALQQLPEPDAQADGDDPNCGTTGVIQTPGPGPHAEAAPLPVPDQEADEQAS